MKTNEDEKNLIIDMMAWLPKLLSGKTLEYDYDNKIWPIDGVRNLTSVVERGFPIRIKAIAFPDAPDGEQWHNPDNLTAEQVGVEDGFRLILESERPNLQPGFKCEGWCSAWNVYRIGSCGLKSTTYRVKTSEHPVGSLTPKVEPKQMTLPRHLMHKDGIFVMVYDGCLHWIGDHVKNPTRDMWIEYDREELTNLLLRVPKGGVTLIDSGYNRSIKGGTFADECQHHEIIEDISKGFQKLGYLPENSFELAIAIMDGRVSKHIRVE